MRNRIISMILCICIFCGLIPKTVFAEDTKTDTKNNVVSEAIPKNVEPSEEDDIYTVTFKDGDRVVARRTVKNGEVLGGGSLPDPLGRDNQIFKGWYLDSNGTEVFYYDDPIERNIIVYSGYEPIEVKQEYTSSSFALIDQEPNISFHIVRTELAQLSPEEAIIVTSNNGKQVPALSIVDDGDGTYKVSARHNIKIIKSYFINGDGTYKVSAPEGFERGATYNIELAEGYNFVGKEESVRSASFSIFKEEVNETEIQGDVKFIKDTEEINYTIGGITYDVLTAEALRNEADGENANESVVGTFKYSNNDLEFEKDEVLCIYENVHPKDRDYVNNTYYDDEAVYVKVIDVQGDTIKFTALDNDNIDEILLLPDTLPFKVEVLPTEETGTVKALEYDVNAWNSMQSNIEEPKFSVGDYVVFYTCDFNDISYDTEVYYGLVTKVDGDELTFTKTTKEAMAEAMQKALNLYLEQDVPGDVLLENIDTEELEMQVQKEVIESGWAKDALNYLAEATSHTQSYAAMAGLAEYSVTDSEGNPLSPEELKLMRGMTFGEDDIKVTVTLDKSSTYFNDGIRFAIQLEGEFSVDVQDSGELKIVLKASFAEELSVGLKINGDCKIGWKVIIPYLKELWVSTDIDLKSYSAVSVDVKLYTVEKEEKSFWEKLKGIKGMDKYSEIIDKISELEEKMSELSDEDKTLFDSYYNDAKNAWESAEIIFDGNKVSYEEYLEIREKLDETAASKQLRELLHLSDDEIDAGLSDLMDRYSEMLETESDWIELVNKEIIDKDIMVYIFAVKLGTNFVVKGNLNLAIGANMEYVVGKRYSLWIDLKNKKSGSSERDLLDEKFGFQFYIMGQLGLKMGVEVEFAFGIGSTKLASIGAAAEFGPYLDLW